MAHNSHIPWTLLSSQFRFIPMTRKNNGYANFYPQFKPNQGSELMHFSRTFAQTVISFAVTERAKYPNPMPTAESSEVVISEETAKKISKTVTHYRSTNPQLRGRLYCKDACHSTVRPSYVGCLCPLSLPERKMSEWLSNMDCDYSPCMGNCSYHRVDTDICERARTMLLYGEIETLLKIVSYPGVSLAVKWDYPWRCRGEGFSELMRCTLMSYIFLNVVYLHTETWDVEGKAQWIAEKRKSGRTIKESEVDYRMMISWKKVASRCTGRRHFDVHTFPHRQFFGIDEHEYDGFTWGRMGNFPPSKYYSSSPPKDGESSEARYIPTSEDVDVVLFQLRCKGLPAEIGLIVLGLADYRPERRTQVAKDPLNPRNRDELLKYLSWCWKVLVWCEVLMTASGGKIRWLHEVTSVINQLWGVKGTNPRMLRPLTWEEERADIVDDGREELNSPRPMILFV